MSYKPSVTVSSVFPWKKQVCCNAHEERVAVGETYPALNKKFLEDALENSPQRAKNTTWIDFGITGYA